MILSSQLIHYCFSIVLFLLLCLCFLSQQPVHVITLTPTLPSPVAPMPGASGQLFLPPLLPSPQGLIPTLSGYTPTSPMQVPANLLSPTIMPFPGKGFSSQLVNLTNFVYVFVGVFLWASNCVRAEWGFRRQLLDRLKFLAQATCCDGSRTSLVWIYLKLCRDWWPQNVLLCVLSRCCAVFPEVWSLIAFYFPTCSYQYCSIFSANNCI